MTFTTISNFDGNTFIDQFKAGTPEEAITSLCSCTQYPLREEEEREAIVSTIDEIKNAWACTIIDDNDAAWFVVIVKTSDEY